MATGDRSPPGVSLVLVLILPGCSPPSPDSDCSWSPFLACLNRRVPAVGHSCNGALRICLHLLIRPSVTHEVLFIFIFLIRLRFPGLPDCSCPAASTLWVSIRVLARFLQENRVSPDDQSTVPHHVHERKSVQTQLERLLGGDDWYSDRSIRPYHTKYTTPNSK